MRVLRLASVFEPARTRAGDGGALPTLDGYDRFGGMQTHTTALTRWLDALGAAQYVVTSRLDGPSGEERLGRRSTVLRVGVRTRHLRQLWAVSALRHVLRTDAPVDVVHVHQGEDLAALPLGLLAARARRCPLVVTVHCSVRHTFRAGTARGRLLRTVGGSVERLVLCRADAVIALAEVTAAALEADGVPAWRLHRIPSGFDPELFERPVTDPFDDVPRPRVGYVGRLAAQKQPELAIRAFERLSTPATLVIVGDGPRRSEVESMARRSPVSERIVVHGAVAHDAVPAVLRSLDVLVMPSAYEELGSVLIEAMACGLPVVAANVGGVPEVVVAGETGLLRPSSGAREWAQTLDELLADPSRMATMGRCARQRAASYAWPRLAERVHEVYGAVLARHGVH